MKPAMLFPDGKRKALILSYDDGTVQDRRLVGLMNQYGLKGTFHLNSDMLNDDGKVSRAEVAELYAGHEVSAHTVNHPGLANCSHDEIVREVVDDRKALESLVGYPVRGMSYPFGSYNDDVIASLKQTGIEYARTVESSHQFTIPDDFLAWHPTIHNFGEAEYAGMTAHQSAEEYQRFDVLTQQFLETDDIALYYVWGHSWEFDGGDNRWQRIEDFFKAVANRDDVHYTTQIALVDYIHAYRQLRFSVDQSLVTNLSAVSVFVRYDNSSIELKPGACVQLTKVGTE